MFQARPYQTQGVKDIALAWQAGYRRVIYSLIAGGGKSTVFCMVTEKVLARGKTMMVMAHRRQLVKQLAQRLMTFNIPYRIEMSGLPDEDWVRTDPNPRVYVCSKDTLISRCRGGRWDGVPATDLLTIDEAHHVEQSEYSQLAARCPAKFWLGLTATPMRPDGSGLGSNNWDAIVNGPSVGELIGGGYLVPLDVYSAKELGKRRKSGDKTTGIAGDPVGHWKRFSQGRPTLGFCSNVAEARFVADQFAAPENGRIPSAVLHAGSSFEERTDVLGRLADGKLLWVGNAFLLGEGVDIPELGCIQLLRKCGGLRDYIQLVSRVMRACPKIGKRNGILIDHSGAALEHRYPELELEWMLDESGEAFKKRVKKAKEEQLQPAVVCQGCGAVYAGEPKCPNCGTPVPQSRKRKKPKIEHELLSAVGCQAGRDRLSAYQRVWKRVLAIVKAKDGKAKQAAGIFKTETGLWPWAAGVFPIFRFEDRERKVNDLLAQQEG